MKKLLSVLLMFALLISLCACGASGESAATSGTSGTEAPEAKTGSFRVGYGEANITPEDPVPLAGYGRSDQRISNGVINYLMATCLAVTDADDNTILLISTDLVAPHDASIHAPTISELTGVPVENIVIAATHTHSSPDFTYIQMPEVARAKEKLLMGLEKAALAAMEDRKPAQMFGGSVKTEGLNFVRHYLMNDGTYCGDNFGSVASGYKDHASEADPLMQLIKFTREGGKDIILTNFQTHPHRTGGSQKFNISADIVGEYRTAMEQELGVKVIYFSGAGGNINPVSRITEKNVTADYKEQGKAMARYAQSVEYVPLNTGKVQACQMEFAAEVDHSLDPYANFCDGLVARWNSGAIETADLIKAAAAEGITINSPYHANAVVKRSKLEKTSSFNIWAYSFGDVGFIAAPYEMFDTNGIHIRENSPFQFTLISTLANGTNGYLPSELAFGYGCYEVDITNFARGTAERAADQFVEMLDQLYSTK